MLPDLTVIGFMLVSKYRFEQTKKFMSDISETAIARRTHGNVIKITKNLKREKKCG